MLLSSFKTQTMAPKVVTQGESNQTGILMQHVKIHTNCNK